MQILSLVDRCIQKECLIQDKNLLRVRDKSLTLQVKPATEIGKDEWNSEELPCLPETHS